MYGSANCEAHIHVNIVINLFNFLFLCRLRRRCCPCRTNAWRESGACWNVKLEKSRLLTRRACAWASATWCYQTSPQRASATASPGPRQAGVTISSSSTRPAALRGRTGAAEVRARGRATTAAITTITPVREGRLCSRAGGREEGVRHRGATRQQDPWCPAAAQVHRTAPRQWAGHPQEGAASRA